MSFCYHLLNLPRRIGVKLEFRFQEEIKKCAIVGTGDSKIRIESIGKRNKMQRLWSWCSNMGIIGSLSVLFSKVKINLSI